MRIVNSFLLMMVLLGTLVVLTGYQAGAEEEAIAPGKFIPTYGVKYGSTGGWPPAEEAARFDLIDVSAGSAHAAVHSSEHGNTWQTLKHLNPNLIVVISQMGPAAYKTNVGGKLGEGWDWVTEDHGIESEDRWTAMGAQYGGYLQSRAYPVERMMNLGNRNWREFWVRETYAKSWSGEEPSGKGAGGILADNTGYTMPGVDGGWHLEGHPDQPDVATDYYRNGEYDNELYKPHMKQFLAFAVPWLEEQGLKLALNFGHMARHPEDWAELDASPHPPFAAMYEGAFFHTFGTLGRAGNFVFRTEEQWLNQINAMRGLRHVRAMMNVRGRLRSDAEGLSRMDAVDASGIRVWDALWYAIASFLQGFDTERQNAYMSFTMWGYARFYWLDEFDPQYLHLGSARGEFARLDGAQGHVYAREFNDGWAMVNPTDQDAMGVPVPGGGQARVLNHDNFKQAEAQPLVSQFDLPVHRGVVLLKPGKQAGNQDNP